MARENYMRELEMLIDNVRIMGVNLEDTLDRVIRNIEVRDVSVAKEIMANDDEFDDSELKIEKQCFSLVLRQTPVAGDWREIASILKLVGDLERIADHCSDISQYTLSLAEKGEVAVPGNLMEMMQVMRSMVYDSITAISENDAELAQKVIIDDDMVDEHFSDLCQRITELMQSHPQYVPQYVDYLMISKYVERIADHATNIAEWVIYIVKNELQP